MERMKILPEIEYAIDVAMDVMKDTWNDKTMSLEEFKSGVLGNAEVIKKACEFMIEWAENYQEVYESEDADGSQVFKFEFSTKFYMGDRVKYFEFDELTKVKYITQEDINKLKAFRIDEMTTITDMFGNRIAIVTRVK